MRLIGNETPGEFPHSWAGPAHFSHTICDGPVFSYSREVLGLIKAHQPDVVLMDISMPGLNGLQALARITRDFPRVRVIILSMHHKEAPEGLASPRIPH